MVRFLRVHYPRRLLILLAGEALIVWCSLLLGVMLRYHTDSYLVLNFEFGYYKIIAIASLSLLLCHWFDLYDISYGQRNAALDFRFFLVPGVLALCLTLPAAISPNLMLGKSSTLLGLILVTVSLPAWRNVYAWFARQPYLRDRVDVLGKDEVALRLAHEIEARPDLGIDLMGWSGELEGPLTRDDMA